MQSLDPQSLLSHGEFLRAVVRRVLRDENRARLRASLIEVQRRMEQELLPSLSEEQRKHLRKQLPLLITLEEGNNVSINTSEDGGF